MIRPCEVLSGVANVAVLEVAHDAHIGVDQSRLIAPVNFSPFGSGALLDAGVLTLQPKPARQQGFAR